VKRFIVVLVVLALAALTAVVWAAQGPPEGRGMDRGQGMDRGMGMMGQAAVAASGNSVYVVSHGMLLKYNSDLTLEKQVELPMPERMGMGRGGGGRGGMRGGGGMGGGGMQ
jgi:hypothetical protein